MLFLQPIIKECIWMRMYHLNLIFGFLYSPSPWERAGVVPAPSELKGLGDVSHIFKYPSTVTILSVTISVNKKMLLFYCMYWAEKL